MARRANIGSTSEAVRLVAEQLRHSARAPNLYGYKPHVKQLDFHKANAKGRQFIGGNRSGKTVAGATEACWWLTGKHPYLETPPAPVRGRIVAVDFPQGVEKIVRPEVAKWLPLSELRGGSWDSAYDKQLRTLHLENGSFVEFMSYDQDLDKFAGTSRHFTWFDEEPPEDIFQECQMRLMDTGGRWWMTMTPVEGMTWTYDRIYEAAQTDPFLHVVEVDVHENTYLNPAEVDAILSQLGKEERKAREKGLYVHKTGLIFRHFNEETHVIDPFIPPKDWLWVQAMDHGFSNPTAWGWFAIDPEGRTFLFDEHYESGRIVSYHADVVVRKEAMYGREPAYRVGDPSIRNTDPITGTSVQLEYLECGLPIILGNNDVPAGLQKVARAIGEPPFTGPQRPTFFVTRNCVNFLSEIKKYRWDHWIHKRVEKNKNQKETPRKKDDHAMDMVRYLFASRPQYEDGVTVPDVDYERLSAELGARKALDPANVIDEALTVSRNDTYTHTYSDVDYTLGGEW